MNWAENSIAKLREAKKSLGHRSGPNVIWMKEREDDSKLRVWDYSLKNGIPTLASALNDWEEGIACLAGKPNSGKSTVLVNMMLGALQNNEDIMILDITLDDPYKKRYEQYIASMTGLYYQEITTKTDLSDTKIRLKQEAEDKIINWYETDRLRTIEAVEKFTTEDDISTTKHFRDPEEIFRLMRSVREQYPNKKIAVFLDAWNNLDMTKAKGGSDISQANYYLAKFQEEANRLGIMVMISAHLRKGEKKSKPTLDDIKGTSDMAYNVVWAGIVINELRERTLKDPLTYESEGKLFPIAVIEIVKSKVSTVDGDLMYILNSGTCGLTPLHQIQYKEYRDKYRGPRR
jgi:hypothetical protein